MTVQQIGNDPILGQVQEHWMKLAALLVWKLAPQGVTITFEEMQKFPANLALLTHGHRDSIEFRMVSREEAEALAKLAQGKTEGRA